MRHQPKDSGTPLTGGRVLVVDDQEHLCWIIAKLLTVRGHEVRTAQTGAAALAALRHFDCQVAVVDYRLPDANGLALVAAMTGRVPDLQAILMTSFGDAALRQRTADAGLFAYIDKPFANDLMVATTEAALCACGAGSRSSIRGDHCRTRFPGRSRADK